MASLSTAPPSGRPHSPPTEFTLAEVTGLVSRITGLAPELAEVVRFSADMVGAINGDPMLRASGLTGAAVASYIAQHIPREIADRMDPARRSELERRAATDSHAQDVPRDLLGRPVFGGVSSFLARTGGGSADGGGQPGSSGNRFTEMNRTMTQARDIAIAYNMPWVANNPELLRLGPAAVQALADVHLRQDSYQRFRQAGLSPKAIVAGARWAKRNGVDYNEFSKAYDETHKELSPEDRRDHQQAIEGLFDSKLEEQEAAKKRYNDAMERLKGKRPELREKIEREQKILRAQQKEEKAADAKASAERAATTQKKAQNDDLLASLAADAPAASPAKPQTGSDQKKPGEAENKKSQFKEAVGAQARNKAVNPKV